MLPYTDPTNIRFVGSKDIDFIGDEKSDIACSLSKLAESKTKSYPLCIPEAGTHYHKGRSLFKLFYHLR